MKATEIGVTIIGFMGLCVFLWFAWQAHPFNEGPPPNLEPPAPTKEQFEAAVDKLYRACVHAGFSESSSVSTSFVLNYCGDIAEGARK